MRSLIIAIVRKAIPDGSYRSTHVDLNPRSKTALYRFSSQKLLKLYQERPGTKMETAIQNYLNPIAEEVAFELSASQKAVACWYEGKGLFAVAVLRP